MLVLTRKKGQAVNVGDDIRIVVLEVAGDSNNHLVPESSKGSSKKW